MYRYYLPGAYGVDKTGTQTVGDVTLTDIKVQYLSGTSYSGSTAWLFQFSDGEQDSHAKSLKTFGWAVRDGQCAYSIGGNVSGLASGQSVVLQNDGGDDKTVTDNGAFTFDTEVAYGGSYAVTVKTQPTGQTCTVSDGSGTATANVSDVNVTCTNGGTPSQNQSEIETQANSVTSGEQTTITVTVRDGADNLLSGISVTLVVESASETAGAVTITPSEKTTNAQGEASFVVGSTVAQQVRFKASFNPDLFIDITWADSPVQRGPVNAIPTLSLPALGALAGLMM
ncbi:Ig-like domain-containing protein, partial [Halochromatium sp.]